jgi:hypothetical protein
VTLRWLGDASASSVREAVAAVAPAQADARIEFSPELATISDPAWCVGTALVDHTLVRAASPGGAHSDP